MRIGEWMQVRSGGKFWPLDPRSDEVLLQDIAHGLSMVCRFAGHTNQFYSVAQHSVLVARECPPACRLWGLLHDAPEAYIGDLIRPLKRSFLAQGITAYRDAETRIMRAVCTKFGLPDEQPQLVTDADQVLLMTERRDLLPHVEWEKDYLPLGRSLLWETIVPVGPDEARRMFMDAMFMYT